MNGAPSVSNGWGDLITLLDACLVNGFGLKSVDSLTRSGNLVTATVSAGHGYVADQVVLISGANEDDYNGEQRVESVTASTFTYRISGAPVSPATTSGGISSKVAPLNWEKPFSGTHKGAYRSKNPASSGKLLMVDDSVKTAGYLSTWSKWANVGIVENMSDINTFIGSQAPYDPAVPSKNWGSVSADQWGWLKWYHARNSSSSERSTNDGGSGARSWVIVGDDMMFYLCVQFAPEGVASYPFNGRAHYCFGDPVSFKASDNFGAVISGTELPSSGNLIGPGTFGGAIGDSSNQFGMFLLRSHTQLGLPVRFSVISLQTGGVSGRGNVPFPNGPDYSLWALPSYIQQSDKHMRGLMPGMMHIPHSMPYSDLSVVDNVVGATGKKLLMVNGAYGATEFNGTQVAFDITGPWR